ncbi:MAG: ABC transporter ATP-binding protein [Gammaproteobacteria bacterium]|nr:ABC transporter ATP-binding protein [Gammaproteobacteria bacterium]MDE0270283.1 ABC transporter ATP-binding protein [Gammaproteobacteria bacterium]
MSTVEFCSVTKRFDDGTVALDSLSLKVEEGEFLVLLGPSGCGKSTALRVLAGLEEASSGDILIGGQRVNDLPPGARGLGMVFQSYALYPHMSVAENLSFGLRRGQQRLAISEGEIGERVNSAVALLDLSEVLERRPRELSGGQQQRVAIGRALVRRPKVLLMDEPLSNLDAKLRNRMRLEIRRLHERHGTTTVYVTHDQVEAMTLADRIAVLNGGRLQQHARPLDAYHRPANSFVASFIGTPPMNLIEGEAGSNRFHAGELSFPLPSHLSAQSGRAFYGIRPEHVRRLDSAEHPEAVPAQVLGRENLGSVSVTHLDALGHRITASERTDELDASGQTTISLTHSSAILLEN